MPGWKIGKGCRAAQRDRRSGARLACRRCGGEARLDLQELVRDLAPQPTRHGRADHTPAARRGGRTNVYMANEHARSMTMQEVKDGKYTLYKQPSQDRYLMIASTLLRTWSLKQMRFT